MHWLLIFIGILFLSSSISNPVYKLTINKYLKITIYSQVLIRFILFIFSILIIFLGLYIESIN